jgi:hypothetical protein
MMAVLIAVGALNGKHVVALSSTGLQLEDDPGRHLGRREDGIVEVPLRRGSTVGRPDQPPGRYRAGLDRRGRGRTSPPIVLDREK